MSVLQQIAWDRALETGIVEVDRQHRGMVDFINTLVEANTVGGRSQVKKVLQGLTDYTLSHFQFEEELMLQVSYPSLAAHKRIHALFAKKIKEFNERLHNGEDISEEIIDTLQRWLISHIKTEDRDYVEAILAKLPELGSASSDASWLGRTRRRLFR